MTLQKVETSKGGGFWYDGQRTEEFNIKVLNKKRTLTTPLLPKTIQAEGHIGEYYARTDYGPTKLEVDITYKADTYGGVRELTRQIAEWLTPELGPRPLIFDDEPGLTYYAVLSETSELDQTDKRVKTTITFSCPDPFAKGQEETFIIRAADTKVIRNTPASMPNNGDFVGKNEPRGSGVMDEAVFYATTGATVYDNDTLNVLLDEKIYLEDGTVNLVKDPAFFSGTPINDPASPWKWITAPSSAKGESYFKVSNDIMKNFNGWHTFTMVCKGTNNIGIKQALTGWVPGDILTISGWFACEKYQTGVLHFDISGTNSSGVEIYRSPGKTVAKECFEFISIDYQYLTETITVPANVANLYVNIYANNNPVFTLYADQIQVEPKNHPTSFICNPDLDIMPGQTQAQDDTQQYVRLPDVLQWPGPQSINMQEGFISIWFFPVTAVPDGVNLFSAGDSPTAGGSYYTGLSAFTTSGTVQCFIGTGSGYYNVFFPTTKLLPGQWNFLCMNWKQFDSLDFYLNGEKVSTPTAAINLTKPKGTTGFIMSDQAGGGQMQCLIDNFYVRTKKVDPEDLENLLYNIKNNLGGTGNLGIGVDTYTTYNLTMQELFLAGIGNTVYTITSPLNGVFSRVGTAPVKPIIRAEFFSSAASFQINHYEANRTIKITHDFTKGDVLTVDCDRQLIQINGWDAMYSLDLISDFFEMHKGMNNLYISGECPAIVSLTYQPNYI